MNEFNYHNIFDTKGTEYLLTIVFFAILIPFWMILNKQVKVKEQIKHVLGVLTAGILNIPRGLFYNRNHTWIYMEKSGVAKVGIDDLLQHLTGSVQIKQIKNQGETIKKGEKIVEFSQNGKALKITSPISGKLVKLNDVILENPSILNTDPYNEGWICSVEPTDWKNDTGNCYLAEDAVKWAAKEIDRFKDFVAFSLKKHLPDYSLVALQDGGELKDNTLSELPEEIWHDFQKEFLD